MPLYGGGSAAAVTKRQTYFTAAPVVFGSDAAWTSYAASIEQDVPAAVGDWVECEMGGMWQKASGDFVDLAVIVGTSLVRFFSNDSATPAVEGAPELYPDTGFVHMSIPFGFTVTSGDLDGGNVRFTVAHKGTPGGGTLYSSSNYPLQLLATNWHKVA